MRIITKIFYRVVSVFVILSLIFCFTSCVDKSTLNPEITIVIDEDNRNLDESGNPISGTIKIKLYPDKAPNSVAYFLSHVEQGIYNNFPVSKVLNGGAVTFGDPWMMKQIRTEIKGEFKENGFEQNDIEFKRGTVALDRFVSDDYDSASGDFFILLDDAGAGQYQNKYAAIGEVISGIEVLDKISKIRIYPGDYSPIYSIMIKTTTAELFELKYDAPVVQDRRTYPGINTNQK